MRNANDSKPIYVQIAEWIENAIIDGTLPPDAKVYSQYQLAELFNINPATAGKGITLLLDEEIVYLRRGLGTFVSPDGRDKLLGKRKKVKLRQLVTELLEEAELLEVNEHQLLEMIEIERNRKRGDAQ